MLRIEGIEWAAGRASWAFGPKEREGEVFLFFSKFPKPFSNRVLNPFLV